MKTKKVIFIIVITLLFAIPLTLSGCVESTRVLFPHSDVTNNDDELDDITLRSSPHMWVLDNDGTYRIWDGVPLFPTILGRDIVHGDIKMAIINQINDLKLTHISEFYNPNNITFDGLELLNISVSDVMLIAYYVPIGLNIEAIDGDDMTLFSFGTGIELKIKNVDIRIFEDSDPITTAKEYATFFEHKGDVRIDNDLFMIETTEDFDYNMLGGLIGESWFTIFIPKLIDTDTAFKIGRDLIESAELVDVQRELSLLRSAQD